MVAVDALPQQLEYLKSGHVQILLAQRVYDWGHRAVEILVDKLLLDKAPNSERDISPLDPVTKKNVKEYAKNWDKWLGREE